MERLDLNKFIHFRFSKYNWDIRPSWIDKIEKSLRDKDIETWRNLCELSEKQLLSIDYISPVLIASIKTFLDCAGLHLGMTEKELDDYQDAEYLCKHPEEADYKWNKTDVDFQKETGSVLQVAHEELMREEYAKKIYFSNKSDQKDDFDDEKSYKRAFAKILDTHYCSDMEWIRHQVTMVMFTHQNFLIKLFCPFKIRIGKAIKKAEIVMKEYQHNMALRSVVYDKLYHDGVIKEWLGEDDSKHGLHR